MFERKEEKERERENVLNCQVGKLPPASSLAREPTYTGLVKFPVGALAA